ncbi:hypothetical protein HYT26_01620 [Candidatus Pacearchaeota archaeon]|nr:hypothetical protein [Candidatus Pacearchaeota archaeon]
MVKKSTLKKVLSTNITNEEALLRDLYDSDLNRKGMTDLDYGSRDLVYAYNRLHDRNIFGESEQKYLNAIYRRAKRVEEIAQNKWRKSDSTNGAVEYSSIVFLMQGLKDNIRERLERRKSSGLEKTSSIAVAIIGILGGIFFLSPNLTGNVIGNMTNSTSSIIGVTLLIIGLIGSFFLFRGRR